MNIEQAKLIASEGLDGCTITKVDEYKNIYAVHFVNNEYLKSRDFRDLAVGAGPRMVVKSTGEMFITGSGQTGAYYAKAYEASGSVYGQPIDSIVIRKLPESLTRDKAILLVKNICELNLAEARLIVDKAIESEDARVDFDQWSQTEWKINKLNESGFQIEQLWGVEC